MVMVKAQVRFFEGRYEMSKGTPGDDRLHGYRGSDTIEGRGGDDVLSGRPGDDILLGGGGDDVLAGGWGFDRLEGGAGDDVLKGGTQRQEQTGPGQDYLYGGTGNDRLIGGLGPDLLVGGSGADRFIFRSASDSELFSPDVIDDFEQSKDKLVFRNELRQDYDLHFVGQNAFSHVPGEVRFEMYSDNSAVLVDLDGNGEAEFRIAFRGVIEFQASDFSF